MSIEQPLERIATATERAEHMLIRIADLLGDRAAPADKQPELSLEIPAAVPAPVPTPAPAAHVEPPPAPPAFVPPPAPAAPTLPFADNAGLIKYCMERYRALGPTKGGAIQGIINGMGCANVADLPSTRWAEFYAQCEAL